MEKLNGIIEKFHQDAEKLKSPFSIKHSTENKHGVFEKSIQRVLKIDSACLNGNQGAYFQSTFNY